MYRYVDTDLWMQGVGLQDVSPLRVLVLIAPAKLRAQHLKHVYDDPKIKCPTLALIGTESIG